MIVMELRPVMEVYDNEIENYSIEAYKMYVDSQNRSFDDCARSVLEDAFGEVTYESIGEEEINALVALIAEETIRRLTDENKR